VISPRPSSQGNPTHYSSQADAAPIRLVPRDWPEARPKFPTSANVGDLPLDELEHDCGTVGAMRRDHRRQTERAKRLARFIAS
jgi:hypothetical protein